MFDVKPINNESELLKMFRLRYDYYSQFVEYPVVSNLRLDIDPYDKDVSAYWGIYDGNKLVAAHRMIKRPNKFMLESEFCDWGVDLVENSAEFSRFAVVPEYFNVQVSDAFTPCTVLSLSCREGYRICKREGIRYVYTVVRPAFLRSLQKQGWNFQILKKETMEDKGKVCLCFLDLRDFEDYNQKGNHKRFLWYSS